MASGSGSSSSLASSSASSSTATDNRLLSETNNDDEEDPFVSKPRALLHPAKLVRSASSTAPRSTPLPSLSKTASASSAIASNNDNGNAMDDEDDPDAFFSRAPSAKATKRTLSAVSSKSLKTDSDDDNEEDSVPSWETPLARRKRKVARLQVIESVKPSQQLSTVIDDADDLEKAENGSEEGSGDKEKAEDADESSSDEEDILREVAYRPFNPSEFKRSSSAVVSAAALRARTASSLKSLSEVSGDLDPALRALKETLSRTPSEVRAGTGSASGSSSSLAGSSQDASDSGTVVEKVAVLVKWKENPILSQHMPQKRKDIKFIIKRTDNFEQLIKVYESKQNYLSGDLVLLYAGVPVFPSATPHILRLPMKVVFEACTRQTAQYLEAQKQKEREDAFRKLLAEKDRLPELPEVAVENVGKESVPADAEEDIIKLQVRNDKGKVEKLKLKKSSSVDVIFNHLSKVMGVDASKIQLKFDGEVIDHGTAIADLDVEDDDMLDAVLKK